MTWLLALGSVAVVILILRMLRIVPEQESWIIEELGKYKKSIGAGMHFVVPVFQKVAYKKSLKEEVIDVDPQVCITKDNVQVTVDGVLYLKVMDPEKASYGIENYKYATAQLAKTTMRSEIGRLELDRTFSEREELNDNIVTAVDEATDPWGIKVTRYEIKDISPTAAVEEAMESQMRAEREKRAEILASEGEKESRINSSKGERQKAINLSMGEKQKKINEAEGRAEAISIVSGATAQGIREIGDAIKTPHGKDAMKLRIAEQYLGQFGEITEKANISILPADLAKIKSVFEATSADQTENRQIPRFDAGTPYAHEAMKRMMNKGGDK